MDSAVSGAMKVQTMQQAGEGMGPGPSAPHAFAPAEFEKTNDVEEAEKNEETPGESTED